MRKLYLMFAAGCFLVFCGLEYKGVALDSNQTVQKPKYYSYHGGSSSSSSGYRSSRGGGYYSHK